MGMGTGTWTGKGNGNRNGNKLLTIFWIIFPRDVFQILYVLCKRHGNVCIAIEKSTLQ
jgi:hypothetical protein